MQTHASDTIYILDNVLTDVQCDEIVDHINNLPTTKYGITDINNVQCYEINVSEIPDLNVRNKIDSNIYNCVTRIAYKLQANNVSIRCRGDTGYWLRKIYGATRLHYDNTVCEFSKYVSQKLDIPNHMMRSVSIIIALNDDYEGGEICFPNQDIKMKLKKGQAIAFPPYWTHPHYTNDLKNNTYRYTITTWLTE
jgi:hypothetical protein